MAICGHIAIPLTSNEISLLFSALLESWSISGGPEIFGVAEGNCASGLKFCGFFFS
jgi:hypothetical protein